MSATLLGGRTSVRFDARTPERDSRRSLRSADSLVRSIECLRPKRADKAVRALVLRFLCFLLFNLLLILPSFAHELRPACLELHETQPGEFGVLWKTPMRGELRLSLSPEFSGRTESLTPIATRRTGGASVQTWRLKAVEPMRGQQVRIAGLEGTMTDALVRMEFADGTTWTQRLTPGQPAATIPLRESGLMVAGVYFKLGVEHILSGIDHLLFVLALLIITGSGWPLLKTVTAFTVAHSITLGLATLGFVQVPSAPVEAVIALSIVFVAAEIVRLGPRTVPGRSGFDDKNGLEQNSGLTPAVVAAATGDRSRSTPSLTARAPWVVAFTFGLLHGFGFAGALNEVGLSQGQIPVALLFFNVGVEAGQLLFVAVVLTLRAMGQQFARRFPLQTLNPRLSTRVGLLPPYAIGSVAMYWVIQRIAAFAAF
jgi:hypothetical protein